MGGTTALGAVQTALYSRLTTDATFMGLVSGVFDFVPDGQAFPYVTLGDTTETRWDTLGHRGRQETLTLHIWDRSDGFKTCQAILARLDTLLDGYALSVTGLSVVLLEFENTTQIKSPDGYTRQIAARYRIITHP